MKKSIKKVVATSAAMLVVSTNSSFAAISADASATVVAPLTVSVGENLNFGSFSPTANLGSVAVVNNVVSGADVTIIPNTGAQSATFDIAGGATSAVNVTVDSNVTLSSGSNSMTAALTADSLPTTLSQSGAASFRVDGNLAVAANQPSGNYTGTYVVTAAYQ